MAKSKPPNRPAAKPPTPKQSGDKASRIASKVLAGEKPTRDEIETLAGSVLSQDQTKGPRGKSK